MNISSLENKTSLIYKNLYDIFNKLNNVSSKLNKKEDVLSESTFIYTDSFEFDANEKVVSDLNFNISGDSVFTAKRFGLYVRRRIEDPGKLFNSGVLPDGVLSHVGSIINLLLFLKILYLLIACSN